MSTVPQQIFIDGYAIQKGAKPYVIAELSGNHNGELNRALEIMEAAKNAGADAVKLQTFTADTITINSSEPEFIVDLPLWKNRTLHDLYAEASTPWEWHEALFAKGKELGITVFSSPFDFTAVDFLESYNVPAYKIASPELVDIPLIEKVASTGKPIIMSTGMATLGEIEDAVYAARGGGCEELILLHCISAYPTPYDEMFLDNISELENKFGVMTGISDHSLGTVIPIAATTLGAVVIEKHVTDSRKKGGVDSAFSLEPDELKKMIEEIGFCTNACGLTKFGPKESEKKTIKYRRSLYVVEDISKGERFNDHNIRSIRPAYGIAPKYMRDVINKVAKRDIKRGEPLAWSMIDTEGQH